MIYLEGQVRKHERVATIVLVDADKYQLVMNQHPLLVFEDERWVPSAHVREHGSPSPSFHGWPMHQGIWRVVLNITAVDPRGVEYKNGDPFDLRLANLRLVEPPFAHA